MWMKVFNSIWKQTNGDEARCFAGAWAAVNKFKMKGESTMSESQKQIRETFTWSMPISDSEIVQEAFLTQPLMITGCMIHAGVTRNILNPDVAKRNLYLAEELGAPGVPESFVGNPIFMEHVEAGREGGKITKCWWGPCKKHGIDALNYVAELHDSDFAERYKRGLVGHMSFCADYNAITPWEVVIPHGFTGRHLAFVASPGDPNVSSEILDESAVIERMGTILESVRNSQGPTGAETLGDKKMEKENMAQSPASTETTATVVSAPHETKAEVVQAIKDFKDAVTTAPIVDLTGEENLNDEDLPIFESIFGTEQPPTTAEEARKWIQAMHGGAGPKKGQLHRDLGIPEDKPIPLSVLRAAAKRKGKVGMRARWALRARGFKRSKESLTPEQLLTIVKEAAVEPSGETVAERSVAEKILDAITEVKAHLGMKPTVQSMAAAHEAAPTVTVSPSTAMPTTMMKISVESKEPKKEETQPMSDKAEGKGIVEEKLGPNQNTTPFDYRVVVAESFRRNHGDIKRTFAELDKLRVIGGRVQEAAYNASAAGSAIPEIWAAQVVDLLPLKATLSATLDWHNDIKGKPGDVLNITTLNTVTFAAGEEQTGATAQAPTTSGVAVTMGERIAELDISELVLEDATPDLITKINDKLAQAYEWDVDAIAVSWLNSPKASIKGTLSEAGKMAGSVIAKVAGSIRAGTQEPYWLVIHPVQEASLCQDEGFTNASKRGDTSIIKSGRVIDYLGLHILVSPQVSSTGGTYRAYMFGQDALVAAGKRDLRVQHWWDVVKRQDVVVATGRWGGTIIKPLAVHEIKTVD
jgi:hypothetical protein